MQKSDWQHKLKHVIAKTWFQWLVASILFFLMSWFLMGSSITSCSSSSITLNSDSSGGLAWFQWASGNDMSWNYTTKSNFPVGEELNRPQGVTNQALTTLYKAFSSLTSPVCGLNLLILLGYMSSGLVMFGLVRWLVKSSSIAFFAGFAAAFVPYHQLKAQSHIVYMYSSVFIAIFWAFLWLLNRPSYKRAAILGALVALSAYIDGYFVLISGVMLVSLVALTLLRRTLSLRHKQGTVTFGVVYKQLWSNIKKYYLYFFAIVFTVFILTLPVLFVIKSQGNDIQKSLAAARGNIYLETKTYGIRLKEFALPAHNNFFVPNSYESWRLTQFHESNPSESTLYAGFTVISLALIAVGAMFYGSRQIVLDRDNITYDFIVYLALGLAVICFIIGLPSVSTLFGFTFRTPVWWLLKFTENWRVFARLFLAIHPMLVVLAALGLAFIRQWLPKKKFYIIFTLICLFIFAEFLPSPHSNSKGLYKDSPKIFSDIKEDQNAKVVAEYPLTDLLYTPTTFTFQQIHGKSVINANDSAIIKGPFDESIAGLGDRQTLGILKSKGVTNIVTYGINAGAIRGLSTYRAPDESHKFGLPTIYSYTINSDVASSNIALLYKTGFTFAGIDNHQISSQVMNGESILETQELGSGVNKQNLSANFDLTAFNTDQSEVTLLQNGKQIWVGRVTKATQNVQIPISYGAIQVKSTAPVSFQNISVE